MNGVIPTVYYALVCTLAVWLGLLGLRTKVRRVLRRDRGHPPAGSAAPTVEAMAAKLGLGAIAALIALVPAGGLPLWKWAFSFCPNPSLPLLAAICAALAPRLFRVTLFGPADWRAAWRCGAIVGTVLYLQPFCLPGFDLYYWGSHPHVVAWTLALAALGFLGAGLRFGVVFLLALAAYAGRLLESHNGWEYTMDPFYWMISVGLVALHGARAVVGRLAGRPEGRRT